MNRVWPIFVEKIRRHPVWVFPALVIGTALVLSVLQISGTSAGLYDYMLGRNHSDQLFGEPRTVRSDEWIVVTPSVVAQYNESFPVHNPDVGSGQDMSIVLDAPYADWSMLFRPHNLVFFILPLGIAFALKWWALSAGIALAVYGLVLLLYPRRYLVAALLGGIMLFSPFIQWWYQSATILPIVYGLLGIISVVKLTESKDRKSTLIWFAVLSYITVCFALIMYPAFQLTVALVSLALTIAILRGRDTLHLLWRRRNLLLLSGAAVIAGAIVGLFLWQHHDAVQASLNTVYPGSRNISSGGFNVFQLVSWPLSYLLQSGANSMAFGNNQSEVSNFLLVGFVISPLLVYLSIRHKNTFSKLEKSLLYVSVGLAIIIAVRMFVPFGSELFSLVGLSKVPHSRLFIGLGLINLVLLVVALARSTKKLPPKWWKALADRQQLVFFGVIIVIYATFVYATVRHFNPVGVGPFEAIAVVLGFSVPSTLLLSSYRQLRIVGLAGVLILGIGSTLLVNPLYRDVGVTNNEFSRYVAETERKDSYYWVANDSSILSAIMLASSAEVYGGVNTYPQTEVWEKYFPGTKDIYNRYAHIRFLFDSEVSGRSLSLIQSDSFFVHISPCDSMLQDLNIRYIVSEKPLTAACLGDNMGRTFDSKEIYIYKVKY